MDGFSTGTDLTLGDDFKSYTGILRRRILPFLAVASGVAIMAAAVIFNIPQLYRSEAKIVQVSPEPNPATDERKNVGARRIDLIRKKVVARDELVRIADKFALFKNKRNSLSPSALVELMRKRIIIEPDEIRTSPGNPDSAVPAYTIGFDYEDPEVAANVANELLTFILSQDQRLVEDALGQSVQFFERQVTTEVEAQANIAAKLTQFKLDNVNSLPERIAGKMSELERLNSSLKELDRDAAAQKDALRSVEQDIVALGLVLPAAGATVNPVLAQIAKAETELAELLTQQSQEHPDVKAKQRQIAALKLAFSNAGPSPDEIAAANTAQQKQDAAIALARDKARSIQRRLEMLAGQRSSAEDAVRALNALLNEAPKVQNVLSQLESKHEAAAKAVEEANKKLAVAREKEAIVKSQLGERFEAVEMPTVRREPVWPDVPKLLAMAAGAAGLAGALVAGLLEFLNRSVRVDSDILKSVNRHPIGVVPYITTREETQQRMRNMIFKIVLAALAACLLLAVVHYFVVPIDMIYDRVLMRVAA